MCVCLERGGGLHLCVSVCNMYECVCVCVCVCIFTCVIHTHTHTHLCMNGCAGQREPPGARLLFVTCNVEIERLLVVVAPRATEVYEGNRGVSGDRGV